MVRCERGHFYDQQQDTSCPHCDVQGLDTHAEKLELSGIGTSDPDRSIPKTRRRDEPSLSGEVGRTRAILQERIGIDPVVGWLVCIEGYDRGRDYRLHSENNFIGRDPSMDICISGDDTISRRKHAIVSFDPENNTFELLPGESRGLVYLNGNKISVPTRVNSYDLIKLGLTKLLFIPLCSDRFHWG